VTFPVPALPPNALRVVHVINDLRVGGAERLLTELAPRLRTSGIDASVAVLSSVDSFLVPRLRTGGDGLPGVPLHDPPSSVALRSPTHVVRLARLLRGADVAHVHLFPAQLWAAAAVAILPRTERPRLVTTEHNTTNRRRGSAVFRALDRAMYARYARIIAISDATAEAQVRWMPATRDRVTVIANGVDVERIVASSRADRKLLLGLGPETPVVACTGRFEEQKDQATLIRALPLVPGLHAVFLGDGPLRPAAEQLAASLGVTDRVHFLGVRDDVPRILKACDLYCQPSRWEGFGLAVVEGMAAGLPALVSDVPGVAEVVGEAGVTFPAADPAALAAALTEVLGSPELLARLKRAAPVRAHSFGLSGYLQAHLSLYQSLQPATS
jgi:glycosyltransferase involved in cell wall biosynthesis